MEARVPEKEKVSSRSRVYQAIYEKDGISRQEIAESLSMSLPTVATYLGSLLKEGLVEEKGAFASTGGRRAVSYQAAVRSRYAVGVEITASDATAILTDLRGRQVQKKRMRQTFSYTERYARRLGILVEELLESWYAKNPEDRGKVLGAGVALPAILNPEGTIILHAETLGVQGVPVELLGRFLPGEACFFHDSAAAGLAEAYAAREEGRKVYLYLSNTVGGALLDGYRLVQGSHGQSAEFGHMILRPGGRKCYCGRRGCADAYVSARRLSEIADGELKGFFDRLEEGDLACRLAWDEYLENLALLISNIRVSFDCELILGGYMGKYLEERVSELKMKLGELDGHVMPLDYLRPCSYQKDAAAEGGAFLMISRFLKSL